MKAFAGLMAFIVAMILAAALSINALSYLNFDSHYGFLRLKQEAIASGWYLPFYYAHVIIAAIILLVGLFQIYPPFRLRWRPLHRLLGKIYVFGVLLFAAPGGLVMSLFIHRGNVVLSSFILQSLLWFMFTFRAFTYIRQRNITAHRKWMLRSMALTLAAITLRVYSFIGTFLHIDLSQSFAYGTIAWMSWVVNLVVMEIYLRESPRSEVGSRNVGRAVE